MNKMETRLAIFKEKELPPTFECLNGVKSSECLDCQNQDRQDLQDNTS